MSRTVAIALIGDVERQGPSDPIPEHELNRPYADRRTVSLDVDDDDRIIDVMAEAAKQLGVHRGIEYEPTYIGFFRPEDESAAPPVFSSLLPLVETGGRVRWTWNAREVTYGQIVEAAEIGAIYGDPERMHFAMVPMVGNGVLPDWGLLVNAYEALKLALEHVELVVAGIEGTRLGAAAFRRLKQRSEKTPAALKKHSQSWRARGGDPHALEEWLDQRPWDSGKLASFLDSTVDEAESVLWAFGFGESADGLWRRNTDETARFMADVNQMVIKTGQQASPEELCREFEQRATGLIETGQAPPLDWEKLEWLRRLDEESDASGRLDRVRKTLRMLLRR